MIIVKGGVTPPLMFKDLANGESFYTDNSDQVFMKAYQMAGIGACAVNLANGAMFTLNKTTTVTRSPAKVLLP